MPEPQSVGHSENSDDDKLLSLSDLQRELEDRNVISVTVTSLKNWCRIGLRTDNGTVHLKFTRVGVKRFSSVAWVREFLSRL